jgi:hypothetical protein
MFGKKKVKPKVFGVTLAESVLGNKPATAGNLVADVVYDVINYLEKHGESTTSSLGGVFFPRFLFLPGARA